MYTYMYIYIIYIYIYIIHDIYTTKNPYIHIYTYQRDEGSEKRWCFSCADTGMHMHLNRALIEHTLIEP